MFRNRIRITYSITLVAFLLLANAAWFGCAANSGSEMNEEEKRLIADLGIDTAMAGEIRALGRGIEPLTGWTEDYMEYRADGFVLLTGSDEAAEVLRDVRTILEDTPRQAWIYEQNFGFSPDKIAVAATGDPYEFMRVVRTNGINYDLDNTEVIEQLKQWDGNYGLGYIGIGFDWVEASLRNPPSDMLAFAREVYAFCPDVVDQGAGTVDALAAEMERSGTLYLWWD